MSASFEPQWERYRPLLRLLAQRLHLDPRLQRRFDASDLVQETMLHAYQNQEQFIGKTEGQWVRWLQTTLEHVALDKLREARAQKRDPAMERYLADSLAGSSARLDAFLAADQSTPSQGAERAEALLRMAEAIDLLPDDKREVLIRHHMLGSPIATIAAELGRTEKSVAGLLYRAKQLLAESLNAIS